jgi:hypothetical protein
MFRSSASAAEIVPNLTGAWSEGAPSDGAPPHHRLRVFWDNHPIGPQNAETHRADGVIDSTFVRIGGFFPTSDSSPSDTPAQLFQMPPAVGKPPHRSELPHGRRRRAHIPEGMPHRPRGHRLKAAGRAPPLRALAGPDQGQEPRQSRHDPGSGREGDW